MFPWSWLVSVPSGDEAGEGEDLEENTLKLQPFLAKAERSHLIVWQVMVNEDWPQKQTFWKESLCIAGICVRPFDNPLLRFVFNVLLVCVEGSLLLRPAIRRFQWKSLHIHFYGNTSLFWPRGGPFKQHVHCSGGIMNESGQSSVFILSASVRFAVSCGSFPQK